MYFLDPAIVVKVGGKVVWVKEKGPEHVEFDYRIYCWLGRGVVSKHKDVVDRIQACSLQLLSLAIICRNYASKRNAIREFHELYLTGPATIPLEAWNSNYLHLEEAVVDIESFFWLANRLLTHVALTLNYFFKKVKRRIPKGKGVKSHSTFVESDVFQLLPADLQDAARSLKTNVSDFRNAHIEHDMKFWRSRKGSLAGTNTGQDAEVKITSPPASEVYPEKPLRDLWIELHDYLTEVAKYIGSQLNNGA